MQQRVITGSEAGEQLLLDGERWQLAFQSSWPALELRDLLMLRDVSELPEIRVLRAQRIGPNDAPGESGIWLLAAQALNETQQRRCRERGVLWLDARLLPAALESFCAGVPATRLVAVSGKRAGAGGWLALLALLIGAGLLLAAHGQREQRISEQNQRAAAVVASFSGVGVPREPVEQLHATLRQLGVPALVGDRVVVRNFLDTAPQGEGQLLDEALTEALRAELVDLAALQGYLEQQARRAGQKRLVMGSEHCDFSGERVMPLPGNRAFVLRLQQADPWQSALRLAGVERIDPQQLHGCVALRVRE